jgi:hypothetical protein
LVFQSFTLTCHSAKSGVYEPIKGLKKAIARLFSGL